MALDLSPPGDLLDLLSNPQRVRDAYILLSLLQDLQTEIIPPGATRGRQALLISGQNAVLPVAIKFTAAIANATATTDSNTTTINALLAQLRLSGINPTAAS